MNKKGVYGIMNIPFGFLGFFILLLVLISLLSVQQADWNPTLQLEALNITQTTFLNKLAPSDNQSAFLNVVNSFIGFIVYSSLEVAKAAVSYSAAHPDFVNPQTLLYLIVLVLALPIAIFVIKFVIIFGILIKEAIDSKKEKDRLEHLRRDRFQ